MADDAGALLVRSGLVSASALDDARAQVEDAGGTLGEHLVAMGALTDDALTEFFRARLLVPQVNPNSLARLSPRVIATIPSDMAIELRSIPVSIDAENNLTVAMSDPSDRHAVDEIGFFTGTYVVRAVATQMQIAWCLAHYYGHVTGLGQRLMQLQAGLPADAPDPAAPVQPHARTRGLTDRVDAARHRAIAPGMTVDGARPNSAALEPVVNGMATPAPSPALQNDGLERPRPRTASGEIRAIKRRAPSIRPPLPVDDDPDGGPEITVEVAKEDDTTEPRPVAKPKPKRRAPPLPDPPELAARAGEVNRPTAPSRPLDREEPRVVIAEDVLEPPPPELPRTRTVESILSAAQTLSPEQLEQLGRPTIEVLDGGDSAPVQIRDRIPEDDSPPILLERRREPSVPEIIETSAAAIAEAEAQAEAEDDGDVVVLAARKPRPEKRTQVGFGVLAASTRSHRDTDAVPSIFDDKETVPNGDATLISGAPIIDPAYGAEPEPEPEPARARADSEPTDIAAAPLVIIEDAPSAPSIQEAAAAAAEAPRLRTRSIDYDSVDDGWGPPGTTIPPPLLGAIPGSEDHDGSDQLGGIIPLHTESGPLFVPPAAASPEPSRSGAIRLETAPPESGSSLARKLEEATARVLELIRALEDASSRDDVIALMTAHLGEAHRRTGFLSMKSGPNGAELSVFAMVPRPGIMPFANLRLDRPSTFQDVVGTRLPYRGPVNDDASRTFLTALLGVAPPEILLVPVSVRDRVVGVLYGESRIRHTFDDQLALAARAAGLALERILKSNAKR